MKMLLLTPLLALFLSSTAFAQCVTAPAAPDCNGTEQLVADGETIPGGVTRWYYGPTATINTLTIDGGTLVVCGNLTVDKFYMNTGKVFVRPGGRFVIGSGIGSGLQFKGDCAIYNYGTCEIQRNLSLENNATAATPNIVMNVLSSSVFKMSNQYLVINNAYSWFVNNGASEFWGIITDNQSVAGSVCLGTGSTTKMAILINKIANAYSSPGGFSCVHVYQYSEFYGKLTSDPTLFACLGSGHTSNSSCIPFGCTPNNWGAAQVVSNCAACGAIAALSVDLASFTVTQNANGSFMLHWTTGTTADEGNFVVQRSADGKTFIPLDSISAAKDPASSYSFTDNYPSPGNNYYMISYSNPHNPASILSRIVRVFSGLTIGFDLYPVPFTDKFFIRYEEGMSPQKILVTDVTGRSVRIRHVIRESSRSVEVDVLDRVQPGLYIVHLQTDKREVSKTIFKQ